MEWLLVGVLVLLLAYTVFPMFVTRGLGIGTWKRSSVQDAIAVTFDDGPDPVYTPQLLDMLKLHGVRATFFVIGTKAEQHPDLIRRMVQEGHQIGIHGYRHLPNWLLWPWTVKRHIEQTADIIKQITGTRPTLYRPTWGLVNFFDHFLLSSFQLVLWSVMVGDWKTNIAQTKLRDRLMQQMRGGDIVVLHDSGETFGADEEAPQHMIESLEQVLIAVAPRGYCWLTVGEMMAEAGARGVAKLSMQKRLLVAAWLQYEALFTKVFGIKAFDEANRFLHYRIRKYQGSTLQLPDGTEIRKGDTVAELHLDNEMLFDLSSRVGSSVKLAIQLIRHMEPLMPTIASRFVQDPAFAEVKALYGVTMINRGVQQFGFSVIPLEKGAFSFFTTLYLKLLLSALHPSGTQRLQERTAKLVPKTIIVSREELLRRYPVQPIVQTIEWQEREWIAKGEPT